MSQKVDSESGVRVAEGLYELRKEDDYYVTSITEGGGDDNLYVVDFRLAAILKKIGSKVPTIHAWKW